MAPRTAAAVAAVAGILATSEALSFKSDTIGVRQFLAANLQPEATARALLPVEDEWAKQAQLYADCVEDQERSNATDSAAACEAAPQAFGRSCDTVVKAVVQGSSGDQEAVHQYLDEVCGQQALTGWKKGYCNWFAATVNDAMTSDSYTNRESLKIGKLCQSFWQRMLQDDQQHRIQEKEDRIAELKAAAETKTPAVAAPAAPEQASTTSAAWKSRYTEQAASLPAANGTTVKLDHKEVAPAVALKAATTNATEPAAAVEVVPKKAAEKEVAKENATAPGSK